MLEVYAYNAGKGDCIRLRYAKTHNIIIDSGTTRFAITFRKICRDIQNQNETLDILILTHADDDHIGGILANLRFSTYACPFQEVWMNHEGEAKLGDANLSTRQNNEVYSRLMERGVKIRSMLRGDNRFLVGANIKAVWPDSIRAETERQHRIDTPLARHSDYRIALSTLAEMPIISRDMSHNNKKSIVFTFEYDHHSILFTGDAWAGDVIKAPGAYDLIKLSHHGSVRNISDEYPFSLRSSNFLICTDGIDHPDKQTIAKLEKWYGEINVYSPSDWWNKGYFVENDREHRIHYHQKEGLVIAW